MDVFIEHLVKKIPSPQEKLRAFFINLFIVLLFLITGFIGFFTRTSISFIFNIAFLVLIVLFIFDRYYWNFLLRLSNKVEFEYALTNGDLDIDKIISQSVRSRIISVNCKDFEFLVPVSKASPNEMNNRSYKSIINVCSSVDSPNAFVTAFTHTKMGYTRLVFEPTDRMLEAFHVFIPNKIKR